MKKMQIYLSLITDHDGTSEVIVSLVSTETWFHLIHVSASAANREGQCCSLLLNPQRL